MFGILDETYVVEGSVVLASATMVILQKNKNRIG